MHRRDLDEELPARSTADARCPRDVCADKCAFYVCLLCSSSFTNKRKKQHVSSARHQKNLIKLRQNNQHPANNEDAEPPTNTTNNNPIPDNNDGEVIADYSQESALPTTSTTACAQIWDSDNNNKDDHDDNIVTLADIENTRTFDPESKAPEFYFCEQMHGGQGAKFLTAKAFEVSDPAKITDQEAKFTLQITKFLNELTQDQQKTFADLMLQAVNSKNPELNIFVNTRAPTSKKDFNQFYLTGPNSVNENLPLPVVKKTQDGLHACVSLIEVIAHLCATATEVDEMSFEADLHDRDQCNAEEFDNDDNPATISTTRAACTLFVELKKDDDGQHIIHLWAKSWSDDFDPCYTKTSRNQVWLSTNTISAPRSEKKGRNTFFMALGRKGDDHSEIQEIFANDMSVLSKGDKSFFHGGLKDIFPVKAAQTCVCVDRPERAALFQIGDHNGTYSRCFGKAIQVDGKCQDNKLPSCRNCRGQRLLQHLNPPAASTSAAAASNDDRPSASLPLSIIHCEQEQCSSWNVHDTNFTCEAPKDCPIVCDQSENAPKPPLGREIDGTTGKERRLPCVNLTIPWLVQALLFAQHQVKTKYRAPDTNALRQYWNKKNLTAYLRTCGVSRSLCDSVHKSAQSHDEYPTIPPTWTHDSALLCIHFAAMHTVFLGHAKSNIEMHRKFLRANDLLAPFGKQANKYLKDVQSLRCTRFFEASPFSTSKWNTGMWVSENYLFFGRAQKLFATLPAMRKSKKAAEDEQFAKDYRVFLRFSSSALSAFNRIMKDERSVGDMDLIIKIYLDSMAEMDRLIGHVADDEEEDDQTSANEQPAKSNSTTTEKGGPNFTKSISLGLLSAAWSHWFLGPAILHWDGGWHGERKIQICKPLLDVRRSNTDWQRIVLKNLWRLETMSRLMEEIDPSSESNSRKNRELEGSLRIYSSKKELDEELARCKPLSAVLDSEGSTWLAFRPSKEEWLSDVNRAGADQPSKFSHRSATQLIKVDFDDQSGAHICDCCWFAPISLAENPANAAIETCNNMSEMDRALAHQCLLLLPLLNDEGTQYLNMCYVIGSRWTERVRSGEFRKADLDEKLFGEWLSDISNVGV